MKSCARNFRWEQPAWEKEPCRFIVFIYNWDSFCEEERKRHADDEISSYSIAGRADDRWWIAETLTIISPITSYQENVKSIISDKILMLHPIYKVDKKWNVMMSLQTEDATEPDISYTYNIRHNPGNTTSISNILSTL